MPYCRQSHLIVLTEAAVHAVTLVRMLHMTLILHNTVTVKCVQLVPQHYFEVGKPRNIAFSTYAFLMLEAHVLPDPRVPNFIFCRLKCIKCTKYAFAFLRKYTEIYLSDMEKLLACFLSCGG